MAVFEIPLTPVQQRFSTVLGGVTVYLTVSWRNLGGAGWVLDLDDANQAPLVHGIPLVTGANLLGQHRHIGIPGEIWCQTDGDLDAVPTFENLGVDGKLYFVAAP